MDGFIPQPVLNSNEQDITYYHQKIPGELAAHNWSVAFALSNELVNRFSDDAQGYLFRLLSVCQCALPEELAFYPGNFEAHEDYTRFINMADESYCAYLKELCEKHNAFLENQKEEALRVKNDILKNAGRSRTEIQHQPRPGDLFLFGWYREPLQWLVLDYREEEKQVLLLSRFALEYMSFDESKKGAIWKNCDCRDFLNNEFFESAFSAEEQAVILTVATEIIPNQKKPANSTTVYDRVFLFNEQQASLLQALKIPLCPISPSLAAENPQFQAAQCCCWWLRSRNPAAEAAAMMDEYGTIISNCTVANNKAFIRPAIYISVE